MKRVLLAAASLVALSGAARAQSGYSVRAERFPGDPTFTELFGINDSGTVVGTHGAASNQGFTLSPSGVFSDTNFPGAAQTQVTGVSSNGTKVGIEVDAAGTTHGFAAFPSTSGPAFVPFDRPGTAFNQLLGTSADAARFAGYSSLDPAGMTLQKAYLLMPGALSYVDVNAMLPGNVNSQATGVNDTGLVTGFFQPTTLTSVGFEEIGGAVSLLDPFGSAFTQALGVSDTGEVVGVYTDAAGVQHGYTDAGGVFASFDPAGSLSTTINGVNDRGQLVGFYTDAADEVVGFEATPVAEPGSLALLGAGMVGLFGMTRRRAA